MGIGPKKNSTSNIPHTPGIGVRRTSYPSGPWVDVYGNPASSPNSYYTTSSPVKVQEGNPNPENWKILKAKEYGKYLILMLQYPDCTNYEGKKILVFENISLVNLVNQKMIDPHFFPENPRYKSPIARFEPTDRGWGFAESFGGALYPKV